MTESIALNSPRAWILACRPKTLGAMLCPVLIGSSLAYTQGSFNASIMLLTLVCALLLQILANVVNDYGDFERGSDTKDRLGPMRAMQMGIISASAMQKGISFLLFFVAFLGMILVYHAGLGVLLVGLLSIFFSIWYTAGPRPLAYLGFSEFAVLIFFGPVPVLGSYYVQQHAVSLEALASSIAPAFLSTALIMTNNLRDINEDKRSKKLTLAVRFGEPLSRVLIITFVLASLISPLLLILYFDYSWLLLSASLVILIPMSKFHILFEPVSKKYNYLLSALGASLYLYGALMSISILYARV